MIRRGMIPRSEGLRLHSINNRAMGLFLRVSGFVQLHVRQLGKYSMTLEPVVVISAIAACISALSALIATWNYHRERLNQFTICLNLRVQKLMNSNNNWHNASLKGMLRFAAHPLAWR